MSQWGKAVKDGLVVVRQSTVHRGWAVSDSLGSVLNRLDWSGSHGTDWLVIVNDINNFRLQSA